MEEVIMEVVGGEGDTITTEEEEDGGTIIIIMVGGAATTTTGDAGVVGGAGGGAGDHMDTLDTIGQYYNCLCVCFYELSIQRGLYREITNISFSLAWMQYCLTLLCCTLMTLTSCWCTIRPCFLLSPIIQVPAKPLLSGMGFLHRDVPGNHPNHRPEHLPLHPLQ